MAGMPTRLCYIAIYVTGQHAWGPFWGKTIRYALRRLRDDLKVRLEDAKRDQDFCECALRAVEAELAKDKEATNVQE